MQAKNAIRTVLFGLGFLSIGTQIYLLRVFLTVSGGNEMILGAALASWMLLTGAGAFLGRFSHFINRRTGFLVTLMMIAGLLPTLSVFILEIMKTWMAPSGSMANLWMIMTAAVGIQLPFCLLNGFIFSCMSGFSADISPASAYSWESMGSMASGALVNLVFLWILGPYQGLALLTVSWFMIVLIFTYSFATKTCFYLGLIFSLSVSIALLTIGFQSISEKLLYRDQQVISNMGTPYGQVVVTRNQGQMNYYENGLLLFSGGNEISNEENVHLAMVQRERPQNVLLISGGYSGTINEILKYKPYVIDYVEMNPSLIGIASKYTKQLHHQAVRVHETDARKFIRKSPQMYDVVLVNLPGPSTLQLNRYYTMDFLIEIKKTMKPGGVIAYSLPTGSDYISREAGLMNATLLATLQQHFSQTLIIPVERNYFLASDSALDIDIPKLIQQRAIPTVYVNQYYMDVRQLRERSGYVTSAVNTTMYPHPVRVPPPCQGGATPMGFRNSDFNPVATFYQNLWWLGIFSVNPVMIVCILAVVLMVVIASLNSVSAGLFTGGFTLASTEILLIFGLQVLYGYVYQVIGLIIMVFMLGLALGAALDFKTFRTSPVGSYFLLQASLAVYSILLPVLLMWLGSGQINEGCAVASVVVFAFLAAVIVGMEYRMASILVKGPPGDAVSRNYSADLFGSGMGAFIVTLVLFPLAGILYTGFFLAVLNMISGLILFIRPRKIVSL